MAKHAEPRHYQERLADAHAQGWESGEWKGALHGAVAALPWRSDGPQLYEIVGESPCVPDAWRLTIEGSLFSSEPETLVLEFLLIDLHNEMSEERLARYDALWWCFESADRLHFRVLSMDRFGIVTPVITEETMDPVSGLRRPPDYDY